MVWDSRGWKQVKEKAGLSAYPSWLWSEVLLLLALLILFEYSWHMMLYLFQVHNITIQRAHSLRSATLFPNAASIWSRVFFLTCVDDFSRRLYSFNEWIYFITGCHLFSKHFAGGRGHLPCPRYRASLGGHKEEQVFFLLFWGLGCYKSLLGHCPRM